MVVESSRSLVGLCFRGAVRCAVLDEFRYALNCHCSKCRRATGSAFKPFGGIERIKLRVTQGASSLMLYGDETGHDARCKLCGSLLYSLVRDGQYVHVKAPWFTITDTLPQHHEFG